MQPGSLRNTIWPKTRRVGSSRVMQSKRLCTTHRGGVPFGTPPFYCEGCERCEAKRAAGLIPQSVIDEVLNGAGPSRADTHRNSLKRRGWASSR